MALLLLGSLLLAVAPGCQVPSWTSPAHGSTSGRRPNVILVMTDDQGYGDVHAHGNTMIRTPNLDSLREQCVRLTDFHVDPTCSPTRSALMTGRYSTRTGVWHTILGRSLMSPDEHTVAEYLRAAGYRTGMFGKWHLGDNWPLRPRDQGFDEAVRHGGGGVGQGPDWWGNDYFDDTYWCNGKPTKYSGYCTDVWFREALRFIENNKDRPFFCYLATNAPHDPLHVDAKWSQGYVDRGVAPNQAKFYGMIENIDWNMGRLMARLDQLGLTKNTIVIFMTDNGTATGFVDRKRAAAGQWAGFDAGMRGHKGSKYDGGHRVPFFIRWPAGGIGGTSGKGRARDERYLAAHIDVLPTLLDLCGVVPALDGKLPLLDGISLASRLRDPDAALPARTLFVHSQRILQPRKWRQCAVMTERWRLVDGKELYDMVADPRQAHDVAKDHADVVVSLSKAYDAWWASLAPAIARTVRIGLGSDVEPDSVLNAHDWQSIGPGGCPWSQVHVQRGAKLHGQWFVDVAKAGEYEFELRRWVRQLDRPLEATSAKLIVGGRAQRQTVAAGATHAKFRVDLPQGPTTVRGILELAGGGSRGAYYVYVSRVR
ncbi:MAG: arylsulfatase [Planctomycetes bacterium]|nr:arylsulfatase [Planctomycetota bacterium]